ncbi:MAG: hypothetical protein ACJAQT_000590 [Akkermansiaceae bacterium]|jgi:uncharacterized protein YbbC (DUF1343 family)/CubicO group peptidase (beta-lactamase class C family)
MFLRFLVILVSCSFVSAQEFHPLVLAEIETEVEGAIAKKKLPGGVLRLEHGKTVYQKSYGNRVIAPVVEEATLDTIYDLASLTKVVATAPAVMKLVEDGKVELDAPAQRYLPELAGDSNKGGITVRHLLTHTSGLAAGLRGGFEWSGYEDGIALAAGEPSRGWAGFTYRYSDLNFILLAEIVARVSGMTFPEYCQVNFFGPLGMKDTSFLPDPQLKGRIAPTSLLAGGKLLRGVVHDPTARRMGGVAGNAGLFSTVDDLARFARMLLNEGGKVLKPETVRLMTSVQSPKNIPAQRGLGFDIDSPYASLRGELFPLGSFGHTGWTGTSLWIDPTSETFVIFLSNRNHPSGGNVLALRKELGTLAAKATGFDFSRVKNSLPVVTEKERPRAKVLNGVDALERDGFAPLAGMRVGLITNQTGINRERVSTIDLLHRSKKVDLRMLFGPEHGIRGKLDDKVEDGLDEKTKLPVMSLYAGADRRKPKKEHLAQVDVLVFDMQDIGARFYTFISTMGLAMEAAEEAGLRFVVLDRVNPIGADQVAGPLREGEPTFTSFHNVPLQHGMTVGEIALLYQKEHCPKLKLTVIPVENWKRGMRFDETGLGWVKPSPNMPNLTAATLYPGLGMLEFTNVSVGRGTYLPFEIFGAPYIDEVAFVKKLKAAKLAGLEFVPIRFRPEASKFAKVECGGVRILLTDPGKCPSVELGILLAQTLREMYPKQWETKNLNTLLRHPKTEADVKGLKRREVIVKSWEDGLTLFLRRRAGVLLYE